MPLSHTYVTPADIKKVEDDIAWYKNSIGRYQAISRGDKDSKKELLQFLKGSRDQSQVLLNNALRNPSFRQYMKSTVFASEVRIYGFVLDLLENPKLLIQPYQEKLTALEKHLHGLKQLPSRDK